ncbi:MAG: hypothetical protein Q9168_002153 [Polycauliona sp. 1 TL-2023]
MLEEYMDESYFEPVFDDGDVNDDPVVYQNPNSREVGYFSHADQSCDSSYGNLRPYGSIENLTMPRSPDPSQEPLAVCHQRDIAHQVCGINGPGPLIISHLDGSPEYSPSTVEPSSVTSSTSSTKPLSTKPVTESSVPMSVYEKLSGARRTSATARANGTDDPTLSQPTGCVWSYMPSPIEQPSTPSGSTSPSQQTLNESTEHVARVETADGISRIPFPATSHSSASTKSALSSRDYPWVLLEPRSENLPLTTRGKGEDWDFSEIPDMAYMDVSVRGRYREGMKGFLRVN